LKSLSHDFDIEKITILDMFPHTHHIETMVLLVPASKSSLGRRKMMDDRMKTKTKAKGASRGKSKR
jgi:hypothetical protein